MLEDTFCLIQPHLLLCLPLPPKPTVFVFVGQQPSTAVVRYRVLITDILRQGLSHSAQQRRRVAVCVAFPLRNHMQCSDAGVPACAGDKIPILGQLGSMHTSPKTLPA